jgi:hypothetical protein
MVEKVAELASPTGHWPEAVHPQTGGGCMGDGQHAWAAAEWVLMIHHMFAAEEDQTLVLLRGIPPKWLHGEQSLEIGPIHTRFGALDIVVEPTDSTIQVSWTARRRRPPAELLVQLPGTAPLRYETPEAPDGRVSLPRTAG